MVVVKQRVQKIPRRKGRSLPLAHLQRLLLNLSLGATFNRLAQLFCISLKYVSMKKLLLLLTISAFLALNTDAQSMGRTYKTALGVKVWDGAGISFKTFVVPNNALEVIGYF